MLRPVMLMVPLDRTRLGMSGLIVQDMSQNGMVAYDTSSMLILSHGDNEDSRMTHHGS